MRSADTDPPRSRGCHDGTAVIRLVGALLSEQSDEWLVQSRYLFVESMALILTGPEPEEHGAEGFGLRTWSRCLRSVLSGG